jgi:hypothetical protein
MPSDFPRSPKFLKGALVAYESQFLGPIPNVIVFQYNPETLSRSLIQRTSPTTQEGQQTGVARQDANRVPGPPEETISLTIHLDAADQLAEPANHGVTVISGLHPILAALELLLYPKTEQILISKALSKAGTTQTNPPDLPIVLFVWGKSRVVPVRLTSFSVSEKSFDQGLNPIQAEVNLGMKVLTYMDLTEGTVGHNAYMVYQTQKEILARLNLLSSAEQILGMIPF